MGVGVLVFELRKLKQPMSAVVVAFSGWKGTACLSHKGTGTGTGTNHEKDNI